MDQACSNDEPICITRTDGPSVVLMSLADYNGLEETLYLVASPANATRLRASLAHARSGEVCENAIIPL
jgi:antitoxin YefM